jgi:cellulose synthase/poly-beta-1,6-N-acetylglucosamine synthase-like glycosyltransferase
VKDLRNISLWDSYNVTEDAELGLRIYKKGYKTYIARSYTFEEAPTCLYVWLSQRSRWIKGFFQTFMIFYCDKAKHLSFKQRISVWIFIALSCYNFFSLPWLILVIAMNKNQIINYLWLFNVFFSFFYTCATAFYALLIQSFEKDKCILKKILWPINYAIVLIYPFYFILHSIACYRAIFEILFKPFVWNKTPHGQSIK